MKLVSWIVALSQRRRREVEMADEMREHLERLAERKRAEGLSADEARYAALRQFGNVAGVQERCREQRAGRLGVWLEQLGKDLGFAVRSLRRSPGFTAIAVITLALGIGAGTAVFSLVNGILLRSLPVPNPHELRVLEWTGRERMMPLTGNYGLVGQASAPGSGLTSAQAIRADSVSLPLYERLREAGDGMADLVAFGTINGINARVGGGFSTTQGLFVSGNFFSDLGVQVRLGRGVKPEDDRPGAPPVAVIGYEWWQGYYGGDDSVLGKTLRLNGVTFTIIGVAPPQFRGAHPGDRSDFYAPLASARLIDRIYAGPLNGQELWWLQTMARLKHGATTEQLRGALRGPFAEIAAPVMKDAELLVRDGRGGPDWLRQDYRGPLRVLLAVVGAVMLVSCANLAGVCLARGEARRHEFAVRAALGSRRGRLLRVALLENVLLSLSGAGLGVALAVLGQQQLSRLAAGEEQGLPFDTAVDLRVLAVSIAAALATAVLSGLLPGWRAAQVDPLLALKRGGGGTPRLPIARSLVTLQAGLAMLLLVGAGLYGRSLLTLLQTDTGYRLEERFVFRVKAPANARAVQVREFHRRIQEELARVPGVSAVGLASFKPMLGSGLRQAFFIPPGQDQAGDATAQRHTVSATFFEAMNLTLVEGRVFQESDGVDRMPTVVVVNETFARKYLPAGQATGQELRSTDGRSVWRVIGVCRDAHLSSVKGAVPPTVFFSADQPSLQSAFHVVRTTLLAPAILQAARKAVAAVDPEVPVGGPAMLDAVRDKALREDRLLATLVGSLGALALGLACLGMYGLIAFTVTSRKRDLGVRLALGARPLEVGFGVMVGALKLALIGGTTGLIAALAVGRLIEAQLHGVSPRDPWTLGVALAVMLLGAIAAALWPAWRAMRVNPMEALRAE